MTANLYLVLGEEEFLAERAVKAAIDAVREQNPDIDPARRRISDLTPGELPQLLTPSLFTPVCALVLTHTHEISAAVSHELLTLLSSAENTTTVVMTHAGGKRGKAFADEIQKLGARVAHAAKLTRARDRIQFVRNEVQAAGGRCTQEAAQLLIETLGTDLRHLATVASQLSSDTQGEVTAEAVARYYTGSATATGFSVADAVMSKQHARAVEMLRWAVLNGVDPVLFADALSDGVRSVAKVLHHQGSNAYQLASALKMPPWKIEKAQRCARHWSEEELRAALQLTAELNRDVRGGSSDRVYAVERCVLQLCS